MPSKGTSKKEAIKPLYIRAPESYHRDLSKLHEITGVSINAICLEILRKGIKERLKELDLP